MKIVVLVPSLEYLNNAGARIRYRRIAPRLAERGIELKLEDINEFAPESAEADVVIISKCHDPLSIVVAATLAHRGTLVGVDLFDDYFSQRGDSRMSRFRLWLDQILSSCDFVLCSTEAMAGIADQYRPGISVHVMNDPASDPRLDELRQILTRKLRQVREDRRISVGWFGVGDNPYFPIGLHDLACFGGVLEELLRSGMDVQLRVLTNPRALTAYGLALLQKLPVRSVVEEWTEEAEQELLASTFVAFLPVNAQPFSTAKSLNRAVTALTSGCQVLSAGYPLYERLGPLIYRDAAQLMENLAQGTMRLSPERLPVYRQVMETLASAEAEASRLADFLTSLEHGTPEDDTLVMLHGHSTSGAAHKLVQRVNGLSIASPYCHTRADFDVIFKATATGLAMQVSKKAARRLKPHRRSPVPDSGTSGDSFLEVRSDGSTVPSNDSMAKIDEVSLPLQLASYRTWMEEMRTRVTAAFGPCRFIVAESSRLPFALVD
jgi:hypothetical protein